LLVINASKLFQAFSNYKEKFLQGMLEKMVQRVKNVSSLQKKIEKTKNDKKVEVKQSFSEI
jgi:hypothetical protein